MKSGFVALIGRSNVGKSTLLNALVGSKVAITTPKAQTTRQPVQGIITDDRGQIVFVDTPGVMQKARDPLTKRLSQFVKESLRGVNVVLYVVDPTRSIGNEEHEAMALVEHLNIPKYLIINKIDEEIKPFIDSYRDFEKRFTGMLEISALRGHNLKALKDLLFEIMPEGEPYYPEYQLSNMPHELWLAELIREKLFLRLREEVPYAVHVEVDAVEERPNDMTFISARILTNQPRYKRMIIGDKGHGVKEIGQSVRKELEGVMGRKVYLELTVEEDPNWVGRL
ncbi:MAG: GTPase Era [Patescibacteria group bacterium]